MTRLMVYRSSKRIEIFVVKKRQNDTKIGRASTSFQLFASHSLLSVKILLNRSNCAKRIGKS